MGRRRPISLDKMAFQFNIKGVSYADGNEENTRNQIVPATQCGKYAKSLRNIIQVF